MNVSTNTKIPALPKGWTAGIEPYWNAVWTATANPLSIGNADDDANEKGEPHNGNLVTRQITGVAAGTALTDAVNVAQLEYAIAQFSQGGGGTGGSDIHFYSVNEKSDQRGNYDNKGATGTDALAAGVDAQATGNYSVAVGNGANAPADGAVAIGEGSIATRGKGNKEGTVSTDQTTGKTTITNYGNEKTAYLKPDNLSTDSTTWVSTAGAVSVGGTTEYKEKKDNGELVTKTNLLTRQITNVAAGSDDTDAVNVAQLKQVKSFVDAKGLKFVGDDGNADPIAKKLNETLQIRGDGAYDTEKKKVADDGNIKTSIDHDAIKVELSHQVNLHQDGSLTLGGIKNETASDGEDPIVIKYFNDGDSSLTIYDKYGKPTVSKDKAGDYIIGLDNKDWNVSNPEYVSGRAATEDQLKKVSDIANEANTNAGKHTALTVNGTAPTNETYVGDKLQLNVTENDGRKTYDLKLGDSVATKDDGLKFVGNDDKIVVRKLNTTLSIEGGITDAKALQNASTKNLGVRSNKGGDGLEIVMTDTPDFTKVTVGGDTKKITIGGQSNSDTKNPANGNYITGLDNTQWDKNHVVENRAATEGQLSQAISEIKGADKGGFGLADENGNTVKKDLGQTITVKGDGKNIETKVNNGALEVSLKKNVDLTKEGSIKAGDTTINKDGVTTNKVTAGNTTIDTDGVTTNKVKVGDITITKDGINGGATKITNIASGIDGKKYTNAYIGE